MEKTSARISGKILFLRFDSHIGMYGVNTAGKTGADTAESCTVRNFFCRSQEKTELIIQRCFEFQRMVCQKELCGKIIAVINDVRIFFPYRHVTAGRQDKKDAPVLSTDPVEIMEHVPEGPAVCRKTDRKLHVGFRQDTVRFCFSDKR